MGGEVAREGTGPPPRSYVGSMRRGEAAARGGRNRQTRRNFLKGKSWNYRLCEDLPLPGQAEQTGLRHISEKGSPPTLLELLELY